MVMDGTPSPQCVGREFVRQYYTLLNEAPQFLHRFYSHNSSFIHGGEDKYEEEHPPVIGQSEIHNKIQSLNFKNCHAKIRLVDSQATIGTGVVVQVTGELSNDGKPLRRFMQTFVLAPQSANKYYVHNDIFRYQDEVFCDSEDEEDYEPDQQPPHAAARQHHVNSEPDSPKAQEEYCQPSAGPAVPQAAGDMSAVVNSSQSGVGPAEPPLTNGHHTTHLAPETAAQIPMTTSEPESQEPPVVTMQREPEPELTVSTTEDGLLNQSAPHSPSSPAMSWARLVDQSEHQALAAAQSMAQTSAAGLQSGMQTSGSENIQNLDEFPPEKSGLPRATMRNNRPDGSLTKRFGDMKLHGMHDSAPAGLPPRMEDRRMDRAKYADNQQVFVGNLPHHISDFELRDLFKDYGNVIEVRVSRSSISNKAPFGFVVFEDEASALNVLSMKTLEIKPGHRVNIEKKNNRSSSGPRQGGRRDNQRYRGGRGGGYSGGSREEGRNRPDQGRYYSNKSSPPYQQ